MKLNAPTKDVDAIVAAFQEQVGTGLQRFAKLEPFIFKDADVTLKNIRETRLNLQKANKEDTIVVFIAGHGIRDGNDDYYFLPPSVDWDNYLNGISRPELDSLVLDDNLDAERRLLMYDTCASGVSIDGKTRGGVGFMTPTDVDDFSRGGIYVLCASADNGLAREDESNGYFTAGIVKGLSGDADGVTSQGKDNLVSVEELKAFAEKYVKKRTDGMQKVQAPITISGENFRLARVP
jgi:uncharacterized caspase-like protein